MKKYFDRLLDFLFPTHIKCIFCQAEMLKPTPEMICEECEGVVLRVTNPCRICGTEVATGLSICYRCDKEKIYLKAGVSAFQYSDSVIYAISKFKYDNGKYLAPFMAASIFKSFETRKFVFNNDCLVVPVPLCHRNYKKRGYNQSTLLAKEFIKLSKTKLELSEDALIRIKDTDNQVGLDRKQRAENMSGAFCAVSKIVDKKTVLLVDDVLTSGATANECAKALLKGGAKEVILLTYASSALQPKHVK
ncbi:MAG: double zinc ribbon domain-containing protein [Firmicutes bacterium]|nr:double zinc ribbon domain-containing protein [Bacillota bacterium]